MPRGPRPGAPQDGRARCGRRADPPTGDRRPRRDERARGGAALRPTLSSRGALPGAGAPRMPQRPSGALARRPGGFGGRRGAAVARRNRRRRASPVALGAPKARAMAARRCRARPRYPARRRGRSLQCAAARRCEPRGPRRRERAEPCPGRSRATPWDARRLELPRSEVPAARRQSARRRARRQQNRRVLARDARHPSGPFRRAPRPLGSCRSALRRRGRQSDQGGRSSPAHRRCARSRPCRCVGILPECRQTKRRAPGRCSPVPVVPLGAAGVKKLAGGVAWDARLLAQLAPPDRSGSLLTTPRAAGQG